VIRDHHGGEGVRPPSIADGGGHHLPEHVGVGHVSLSHDAEALGLAEQTLELLGGGPVSLFDVEVDHGLTGSAVDRRGTELCQLDLELGKGVFAREVFGFEAVSEHRTEGLAVLLWGEVVGEPHVVGGDRVHAFPDLRGQPAVHLQLAEQPGDGATEHALSLCLLGRHQRGLVRLRAVVLMALDEHGHAAVPHHGLEVAFELLTPGVVAARHVLGVILAVGEDRAGLEALVGLDALELLFDRAPDRARYLGFRVEEFEPDREVCESLLPRFPLDAPGRVVTVLRFGLEGAGEARQVGVELLLFDLAQGLVELYVVEMEHGVGGDEHRHLHLLDALVSRDHVVAHAPAAGDEAVREELLPRARRAPDLGHHVAPVLDVGVGERERVGRHLRLQLHVDGLVIAPEPGGQILVGEHGIECDGSTAATRGFGAGERDDRTGDSCSDLECRHCRLMHESPPVLSRSRNGRSRCRHISRGAGS